MEDAYVVTGGRPLKGEIKLSGAKNVALKVIIAALLFNDELTFSNIPKIKDIEVLLNLVNKLGASAYFFKKNQVYINPINIKYNQIDLYDAAKIRVSFMFFAPLLHRLGKARIPNPGGCRLGGRPIDRSISLIQRFGVNVNYDNEGFYNAVLNRKKLLGTHYQFEKPSHTGTELAILLATLAEGETVINNASLEPEIDDLINFLNLSGAKIKRKNREIIIQGVKKLRFKETYQIISDRNEAVTYAIFALATKGQISISPIDASKQLDKFIHKLKKSGAYIHVNKDNFMVKYLKGLKATTIATRPHPGFMTDWQAPWAVLMTQAKGTSIIHETVFENRFSYVPELKKLGAKIDFFQPKVKNPKRIYQFNFTRDMPDSPQAIKIYGQTALHNGVLKVSDLRAGASLLIAAAVASGKSVINGASIIDRGYEDIDKKLKSLGLNIKKI